MLESTNRALETRSNSIADRAYVAWEMDIHPAPTTSEEEQQCGKKLFALPPELRNRIYELLLQVPTRDGKVTIVKFSNSYLHTPARRRRQSVLSLLLVCSQIHKEAVGLFYAINHLRFVESPTGSNYLREFLAGVGEKRLEAVTAISFVLPESIEAAGLLWMLHRLCPRLRVMHVMPAYVTTSETLDKHLNSLILEFGHLEEFKVIDAPWRAASDERCEARIAWLRSVGALVKRSSQEKRRANVGLEREERNSIAQRAEDLGRLQYDDPFEWSSKFSQYGGRNPIQPIRNRTRAFF